MKRIVLTLISAPIISLNTLVPVLAETTMLSPHKLVFLAFQGVLKRDGIPSGSTLVNDYLNQSITPEQIVQAAVKEQRLPAYILTKQDYIGAVNLEMEWLVQSQMQ